MQTRRQERQMQLFIASIVLAAFAAVLYIGTVVLMVERAKTPSVIIPAAPQPAEFSDWRPDIRHCHAPDVDLWDCIRNPGDYKDIRQQMFREDI